MWRSALGGWEKRGLALQPEGATQCKGPEARRLQAVSFFGREETQVGRVLIMNYLKFLEPVHLF